MKLDKEKQKILIVALLFVALVVACLYNFGVFGGAGKPAVNQQANTEQTKSGETDQMKENEGKTPVSESGQNLATLPRRDPFYVQSFGMPISPEIPVQKSVPTFVPKVPAFPKGLVKPANPFGGGGALPGGMQMKIVEPERPVLTGVLLGHRDIALLRYNGRNYVVTQGERFAGKYRLLRVLSDSVVLQEGSSSIRIGLGGIK